MSTFNTILLINLSATVVLVLYCLSARLPFTGYSSLTWLMFCLNALITQVIGYLALTYAQGRLPAWIISPIMVLQPVLTALLAIPLVGEPLGWNQIIGGATVVAGIFMVNRAKNFTEEPEREQVQTP